MQENAFCVAAYRAKMTRVFLYDNVQPAVSKTNSTRLPGFYKPFIIKLADSWHFFHCLNDKSGTLCKRFTPNLE